MYMYIYVIIHVDCVCRRAYASRLLDDFFEYIYMQEAHIYMYMCMHVHVYTMYMY